MPTELKIPTVVAVTVLLYKKSLPVDTSLHENFEKSIMSKDGSTPQGTAARRSKRGRSEGRSAADVLAPEEPGRKRGAARDQVEEEANGTDTVPNGGTPFKRGRGRPRKDGSAPASRRLGQVNASPARNSVSSSIDGDDIVVKRGRGRPRKDGSTPASRGSGRANPSPAKNAATSPKNNADSAAKRGRGRPRKDESRANPSPAKNAAASTTPKRGRGRPRKDGDAILPPSESREGPVPTTDVGAPPGDVDSAPKVDNDGPEEDGGVPAPEVPATEDGPKGDPVEIPDPSNDGGPEGEGGDAISPAAQAAAGSDSADLSPKRGRGRPRKKTSAPSPQESERGRPFPASEASLRPDGAGATVNRGRGRPRKIKR